MPIATYSPTSKTTCEREVKPFEDGYQTITNTERDCSLGNNLKLLDGSPMVVNYFTQLIDVDDGLHHVDVNLSTSYQQLDMIRGMVLMVTQPFEDTIDPETHEAQVTGTATFVNVIVPNVGDVFITDLGTSGTNLFRVTDVEITKYLAESYYIIKYKLFGPISTDDVYYIDLQNKTNNIYEYDQSAVSSCNALVESTVLEKRNILKKYYCTIANNYVTLFVDKETDLLLFKEDFTSLYDHHLARLVEKVLNVSYFRYRNQYRKVYMDIVNPEITILDTLINRDNNILKGHIDEVGILSRGQTRSDRDVINILHTPCTNYVSVNDTLESSLTFELLSDVVINNNQNYPTNTSNIPYFYPVLLDSKYILSSFYYSGSASMSVLEQMITTYLSDGDISEDTMLEIYDNYKFLDDIDMFYLTPIILLLTNYIVGG